MKERNDHTNIIYDCIIIRFHLGYDWMGGETLQHLMYIWSVLIYTNTVAYFWN